MLSNVLSVASMSPIYFDNGHNMCLPYEGGYIYSREMFSKSAMIEAVISEHCPSTVFNNSTNTICLNDIDFKRFILKDNTILQDYSMKANVPKAESLVDFQEFARTHKILVTPTGLAKVFNVGANSALVGGSAVNLVWTTSAAQISGLSGVGLIIASPITLIAAPALIGFSFSYLECLTRGTAISSFFHVGARICLAPMKLTEITLNSIVLSLPNKLLGTPLVINATDTILNGFGFSREAAEVVLASAKQTSWLATKGKGLIGAIGKLFSS